MEWHDDEERALQLAARFFSESTKELELLGSFNYGKVWVGLWDCDKQDRGVVTVIDQRSEFVMEVDR